MTGQTVSNSPVERWSDRVVRVLAPNPSPMTLDGTNTFVVAEPGASSVALIDPGPPEPDHLQRVLEVCGNRTVDVILLTHTHVDHSEGVDEFAAATGAPVAALDPEFATRVAPSLTDEVDVEVAGLRLTPVRTPGHAADHCCFVLAADGAVFTGDHVLGRGTTVVAWPDGDMGDYLRSLERVLELEPARLFPGHGPPVPDAQAKLREYLAHRLEREQQVLAALAAGDGTPAAIVNRLYADVDQVLHWAAELSVRAHLAKLVTEDLVREHDDERFTLA
jgi:glyoxylase-like metal-dependent hydrolase (beta-lactamase superfamily II)